jgi:transposase
MGRFVEEADRSKATLLPECLDDFIAEGNPIRIVDVFVDELELASLGFAKATPAATGRPSYHPAVLLQIYIYGYLNRVQSSRRLERECQRNVELMWLTGRLASDFKTIAECRPSNGADIRNVCRRFVVICRDLKLFTQAIVAIDSSKFMAVNSRDNNFMPTYWSSACPRCPLKGQCTPADYRRIRRWEHEAVIEDMQLRRDRLKYRFMFPSTRSGRFQRRAEVDTFYEPGNILSRHLMVQCDRQGRHSSVAIVA